MKIRNGFVSNSSSSSFIIYGNKVETEEDLEDLLRVGKKQINKEAKKYYKEYENHSDKAFEYLLDKFKDVDKNTTITKDDQYYDLEERKVYEVDQKTFADKLNDKDSWIYKTINENVRMSLYNVKIHHRDSCTSEENFAYTEYIQPEQVNKELCEDIVKVFTKEGIEEIKGDLRWTKDHLGNDMRIYFVSFSTDDGKPEPFDSFFRSGIPFKNANKIRDERS